MAILEKPINLPGLWEYPVRTHTCTGRKCKLHAKRPRARQQCYQLRHRAALKCSNKSMNKELLYQKLKGGPKRRKRSINPYLLGQRLDNVVAKKSVPHFSEEDEEEVSTTAAPSKPTI
ncbi:hypothetical protein CHARACLAT_025605 [Characodon lateralis]|uniref:Neuroendocrine protein 7B2 n=1 Tax=Characodon lateralis TaxID=208331 RepID=A0ABU7DJP2_9TELE|nr:hypothetical protein [Characodon lateralis]